MPRSRASPSYAGRATPLRPAPPSDGAATAAPARSATTRQSNPPGGYEAAALATRRGDGPTVRPYSRGSRAKALSVARNPEALQAAVSDIVADAFSQNTIGPRAAKLNTWRELMVVAGLDPSAHPTVESLRIGAGSLRAAGYRSVMSYVDFWNVPGNLCDLLYLQVVQVSL